MDEVESQMTYTTPLTRAQFWDEFEEIVSTPCASDQLVDNALRLYLELTTSFKNVHLHSESDIDRCSEKLLQSALFRTNKDYVRIQIVYSLLQEDDPALLHLIGSFLLLDGRQNDTTFQLMNSEGCVERLSELIRENNREDPILHRLFLELFYEMSRMQKLSPEDLAKLDDDFVVYLLSIIEELSDDVDDPYHYPVIRVLLVLNEQYMVLASVSSPTVPPPTNRVIKVLSVRGASFMTFGENIILLLNRETETSLQLLILKLLYLLFTNQATYEYFYTNDLRVLLDVIVRNLLDLPNELVSLRHTYLRVLHPLLAHTQLNQAPHYKREEIIKVLSILGNSSNKHWEPADGTTLRLVKRVAGVPWLKGEDIGEGETLSKPLGISLSPLQIASSVSVLDVVEVREQPGVQTPSRNKANSTKLDAEATSDGEGKELKEEADYAVNTVKIDTGESKRRRPPPPPPPSIQLNGMRKMPPKAPPPRRTRLRSVTTENEKNSGHSLP